MTGWFQRGRGLFALVLSLWAPAGFAMPPNDDFADALQLVGSSGQVAGDNRGATKENGEDIHAGNPGGASVWYRWRPGRAGVATIYTFGSDFDTLLAVYTGSSVTTTSFVEENDDANDTFQSRVRFLVSPNAEYRIAVDGWSGQQGELHLTWHLTEGLGAPENSLFADRVTIDGERGRLIATNVDATNEAGEPEHFGQRPAHSVWWTWTAQADGLLVLDTTGSDFPTILAVYTGDAVDSLTRRAQDGSEDFQIGGHVEVPVEAGVEYRIAVDGFDEQTGTIVLSWLFTVPCFLPDRPRSPAPADGAVAVERRVTLSWNGGAPRGEDAVEAGRGAGDPAALASQEWFEIADEAQRRAADAVALVLDRGLLIDVGADGWSLPLDTSLDEARNLCDGERFATQPSVGSCGGVLVGERLLLTAASCLPDPSSCEDSAFVFGYRLEDSTTVTSTFASEDVYFCADILASAQDAEGGDWALVRLDRPVVGRTPLRVRRFGAVEAQGAWISVGHPSGLPLKLVGADAIEDTTPGAYFSMRLDGFGEALGAPVLDAETLTVEGVISRGGAAYRPVPGRACNAELRCETGDCPLLDVTRTTELSDLIPPDLDDVVYRVRFGECGTPLAELGVTRAPTWEIEERLEPGTLYCWQVVAVSECGELAGPEWTFVTDATTDPVFRRADANQDEVVNLSDGVAVLAYLFQGGTPPACLSSVDTDDSGQVNLSDPVLVLNHLFNQGPPPAPPYDACGTDPTEDALGCDSFAPCSG